MSNLATTEAIVLAGGRGTRLRSVVSDRPKVLAEVLGRPFLSYLLDLLRDAGVRHTVLSVGYMAEMIEQSIGSRHGSMEISYSHEDQPLGTGGGARLAAPCVQSDPVLVLNGDSYCHLSLPALVQFHHERSACGTLAVLEIPDASRYGLVRLGGGHKVEGFDEKVSGKPGFINAGVYLLSSALLRSIPTGRLVSLEREMFPAWVEAGLSAFVCQGPFLDVGTPESYARAERFFSGL